MKHSRGSEGETGEWSGWPVVLHSTSEHGVSSIRLQLKCDGTRWRTGGEVKGKLANGVGSQYSSHYLRTWCIQHYYHYYCVRFTERANLVSECVPSRFKRALQSWKVWGENWGTLWKISVKMPKCDLQKQSRFACHPTAIYCTQISHSTVRDRLRAKTHLTSKLTAVLSGHGKTRAYLQRF